MAKAVRIFLKESLLLTQFRPPVADILGRCKGGMDRKMKRMGLLVCSKIVWFVLPGDRDGW